MSNKSDVSLISRWEFALSNYKEINNERWGIAYKYADFSGWGDHGDEENAACNACWEFERSASDFCIGRLNLDFPRSTHGDCRIVSIYVLPGGTTLLTLLATYEVEGPLTLIHKGQDFNAMLDVAHGLLFDDSDYGEIQNVDDNPDYDPDVNTTYEGEAALKLAWSERFVADCHK